MTTTVIENREFACDGPYRVPDLTDVELRRCNFVECQHPAWHEASERPMFNRVNLVRCHVTASDFGPVIAEDCVVDTVWFHRGMWGPQLVAGCAFKHVVIRGNVTGGLRFGISNEWHRTWPPMPIANDPLAQANARYYADVDWALDISDANFTGIEMSWCDIPARLIRRDPETQVVVTRESATHGDWRAACGDSPLWVGIERFLDADLPDTVLVAARRSKRFAIDKAAIDRLCAEGIASR
jgi:hypothetical protein